MFKNKRKCIIALRSLITILLFFSLIFNSTFHPQNARAAEPSAPIDVNHSLGVASNFNAFILNNMTMPNSDSEGRIAVGNSLNVSGYGIASKLSNNNDVNLVVGNELHYHGGELKGRFVIGENGGPSPIIDVSDYLRAKQVTDKKVSDVQDFIDNQVASFAEARTQLIGISQSYQGYSASQPNGTINKSGSRLTFSYSGSSDFVVFSLSSSEFSQAGEMNFDVAQGKTIIINITGATVNWPSGQQFFNDSGMHYGDNQAAKILFNFPDATTINLGNIGIFGSVLAPKATVNASWGQLNGTLIANNFNNTNGSMEVHFALFKPNLPPTTILGKVIVKKVDAADHSKTLSGAVFDLQKQDGDGWTKVETLTTGQNGTISKDNLPLGTYRLVETKAPTGYEKGANPPAFDLTKTANEKSITVENAETPVFGKITVKKVDAANLDKILSGAEFDLEKQDGENWTKVDTLTTGQDGTISKDNLPLGTYRIVETKAPEGYEKGENPPAFDLTKTANEKSITVENAELPVLGKITVKKVDAADLDKILSGAEFDLEKQDGDNWTKVDTLTTGQDGTISKGNLPLGTYRIVETKAPEGYEKGENPPAFDLTKTANEKSITVENAELPVLGKITVKKVDAADLDKILSGAEFDLEKQDGDNWTKVDTLTTGQDGTISKGNLPLGTYRIVETKAPEGYEKGENPPAFDLTKAANEKSITVENAETPVFGKITVKKVDAANPDKTLSGAVFDLEKQDGDSWTRVDTLTTGQDGTISKDNLPLGTYRLVETKAPDGYEKEANPQQFDLTKGDNEKTVTVKNTNIPEKVLGTVTLKKVDSANPDQTLEGAVFDLQQLNDSGQWNTLYTLTTDDKGEIEKSGLELGTYRWMEKTAPTGYVLSSKTEQVTLTQNEPKASTIFENTKRPEKVLGTVALKKVDAANPDQALEGAVFNLQQLNESGQWETLYTLTTDDKGEIEKSGLELGTYRWMEKTAPTGYVLSSKTEQVTLTQSDPTSNITFENTKIPEEVFGSLSLKKVDSTNLDQALEGAVFDLQQLNESGQWNTLYTLTTDDKGEIEKSGLELGTYRFVEKTAPTGYVLSSKTEQVTLTQNEPKASTIFENTKRPEEVLGTVALKKVDSSNPDQILEGAIFDLQQLNESGQWNTLYTLTTDDKGEIEKSGLELGTYRWVEKTAPTGYVLSSKTEQVTLTQNEPKASTIFENTKQPEEVLGTVTLKKVDAANPEQTLEGAVFDLQQLNDSGQWNTLYTLTTDDKGEIEKSGLELGTYRWMEKTAPTGYVLSSKTEQVTLTQNEPKASTIFENTKQPEEVLGTVTLKKVDAANPEQTLEGAVFELQKLNNQSQWETLYTLTTDKNGEITKNGLELGTYQWVEIQAPTGYALSAKPEQFTLTQSNQQFSITFENTIISETVTPVPPTPPTPSQPIVPLQPLTPAVPSQTPTLERGVMGEEQVQDQPIASEPEGQTPTDQATHAPLMQRGFLAETQYSVPTKESTLPITGDSSNSIVYWFGALLIFAAGIIGFARRRKTKKMR